MEGEGDEHAAATSSFRSWSKAFLLRCRSATVHSWSKTEEWEGEDGAWVLQCVHWKRNSPAVGYKFADGGRRSLSKEEEVERGGGRGDRRLKQEDVERGQKGDKGHGITKLRLDDGFQFRAF